MEHNKGRLFVLVGPSGVGKGTLREHAFSNIENLVYSISHTTRKPRKNEREGVEYHFVSTREFENELALGMFLEYAVVHGDYYGTPRANVEREMEAGRDVILEIDVQGAEQIQRILPDSVLIFITPPSLEVLAKRLRDRKTETEEKIALRLENAKREMEQAGKYPHIVVNDELKRASEELRDIILSYRDRLKMEKAGRNQ